MMDTKTTIGKLICIGYTLGSGALMCGQVRASAGVNYQQVALLNYSASRPPIIADTTPTGYDSKPIA